MAASLLLGSACVEVEITGTTLAAATSTTTATDVVSTSTPPVTGTAAEDDPLCLAYQTLVDRTDGHLPVGDAGDLEVVRTATVEFYTEAVRLVDPSQEGVFSQLLAYEQALSDWSEAHEWSPTRDLADLAEDPPPTVDPAAVEGVRQVLADRCGVETLLE